MTTTTDQNHIHLPGAVYPVGTAYSNADYCERATNTFSHGFQVFAQHTTGGIPTGRRSILSNEGILCGLDMAQQLRAQAIMDTSQDLLDSLRGLVDIVERAGLYNLSRGVQLGPTVWYVKASEQIEWAKSILEKAEGHEDPSDACA